MIGFMGDPELPGFPDRQTIESKMPGLYDALLELRSLVARGVAPDDLLDPDNLHPAAQRALAATGVDKADMPATVYLIKAGLSPDSLLPALIGASTSRLVRDAEGKYHAAIYLPATKELKIGPLMKAPGIPDGTIPPAIKTVARQQYAALTAAGQFAVLARLIARGIPLADFGLDDAAPAC